MRIRAVQVCLSLDVKGVYLFPILLCPPAGVVRVGEGFLCLSAMFFRGVVGWGRRGRGAG